MYFATDAPEAWWPAFSKHLTPAAQEVWQYTDPRRVPSGAPKGSAEYGPVSATDAEATVPTTIGDLQLVMVRAEAGDPWKVSYMEPPAEGGLRMKKKMIASVLAVGCLAPAALAVGGGVVGLGLLAGEDSGSDALCADSSLSVTVEGQVSGVGSYSPKAVEQAAIILTVGEA